MSDRPAIPFQEIHVCSDPAAKPDTPIIAMARDSRNDWWHLVGGEVVKRVVGLEELLILNHSLWRRVFQREIRAND